MLEAPLPLLVGITNREYKQLIGSSNNDSSFNTNQNGRESTQGPPSSTFLSEQEMNSKIWVFLEKGEVKWNK